MPRQRWLMMALCFAATTINYVDRATVAVAAPFMAKSWHIGPATMGLILSGFFWTYAAMQIPAGLLVDRRGPRPIYAAAVGWWSAFTAATAIAGGAAWAFVFRLLLGVGEAASYPSNAAVAARWFPRSERGLAAAIFDSGSRAGSAVALPIVAGLIAIVGWRGAFVCTGAVGLVWVAVWLAVYRDPARHRGVSPAALAALRAAQGPEAGHAATPTRAALLSLFRHRTLWGMMGGFFCLNFVAYFFITWFPTYLLQTRGFSLRQLGLLGMVPGLAAVGFEWVGGWTSDALQRRGWSLTAARKTCLAGGMLASSVIALVIFVHSVAATVALFSLSLGAIGFAGANIWALPSDVAPTPAYVAVIGGIQNAAANLAGIAISTFTGVMLLLTHGSFVVPLLVAGGFCLLGAFTYAVVVGRLEPLPLPDGAAGATWGGGKDRGGLAAGR